MKLYGKFHIYTMMMSMKEKKFTYPILQEAEKLDMIDASRKLGETVLLHSAILADGTGMGKTITALLVALFHSLLTTSGKPTLLLVPASLINQTIEELKSGWSYLRVAISYKDHANKTQYGLQEISATSMKILSGNNQFKALPNHLSWVFSPNSD